MIRLENLHKSFGGRAILNGLDLSVAKGDTLVIIGRSGIGKSVTLRHVVGLLRPDRGKVLVFDKDVARLSRSELAKHRSRIGYLFQDGALLNWLTVGENVALPLREHHRMPEEELKSRVSDALRVVELLDAWDKYPSEISGGMRKRSGLARALVTEPEILLYDEPTSGLDPISSSIINHHMIALKKKFGVTQVVVTHDMNSAYQIADRIALLHDGSLRAEGTPAEIQASSDPAVYQFIRGEMDGPMSRATKIEQPHSRSTAKNDSETS